eukprot:scaffold295150_cov19-Tisochrysis_lutea.AAC.1
MQSVLSGACAAAERGGARPRHSLGQYGSQSDDGGACAMFSKLKTKCAHSWACTQDTKGKQQQRAARVEHIRQTAVKKREAAEQGSRGGGK